MAQGSETALAHIVARELGIELDQFRVVQSDASVTPYERTTGASRTTVTTGRQLEILRLLTEGLENKQIARQLSISETTVKSHLRVIYARLDAHSRAEAATTALRLGLVD